MTLPDEDLPAPSEIPVEEEFAISAENSEEDEEDGDEGEEGKTGGKQGGGGGKKPGVDVEFHEGLISEEDLREYDSESLIEKLKLLALGPLSAMIPGASAFESESDLKRKLFLGQIGILTQEIEPNDIADPDLIAKLEKRNQARQAQQKAEQLAQQQQKKQALELAAGAAVAGAAVGLEGLFPSVQEAPQKPPEKKLQIEQVREASDDLRIEKEDYEAEVAKKAEQGLKPEVKIEDEFASVQKHDDEYAVVEKKEENSLDAKTILEMMEASDRFNEAPDYSKEASGPTGFDGISDFFNTFAQMTKQDMQPDQKTDLKLRDPAPKMDAPPPMGS